jgi:nucleoside-diphosphate-sugar epimerase
MGESLALNCGRKKVRVARLSNIVGGEEPSENFIQSLVRDAKTGCINLHSALESKKDYLHVYDAVKMLEIVAENGTRNIYNIASGRAIENRTWINSIVKRFGCQVEVIADAPTIIFPAISVERFLMEFSILPEHTFNILNELK